MIRININPIINMYVIYALPLDVIALRAQQVSVVFCEEAQDRQVNLWHNFYFYSLVLPLLHLLVLTFKISRKTGQSFENRLPLQLLLPLLPLLPLHEPQLQPSVRKVSKWIFGTVWDLPAPPAHHVARDTIWLAVMRNHDGEPLKYLFHFNH